MYSSIFTYEAWKLTWARRRHIVVTSSSDLSFSENSILNSMFRFSEI